MIRYDQICTDMARYAQIWSDMHRYGHICTDMVRYAQIWPDMHRYGYICTDMARYAQICTDMGAHRDNPSKSLHGPKENIRKNKASTMVEIWLIAEGLQRWTDVCTLIIFDDMDKTSPFTTGSSYIHLYSFMLPKVLSCLRMFCTVNIDTNTNYLEKTARSQAPTDARSQTLIYSYLTLGGSFAFHFEFRFNPMPRH